MSLIFLVVSIVLFLVAGIVGAVGSVTPLELVAFGLASFAAAHLPLPALPR